MYCSWQPGLITCFTSSSPISPEYTKATNTLQYVCYNGNFLCPIINGEPLKYCNGACYSGFMYTCTGNALAQLPELPGGTPFTLTVSNPRLPIIDGKPINACGLHWQIGGKTCSYCPDVVGSACPPGTYTAMMTPGAMDVEVPGGQQVYLGPFWNVAYTQAHSANIPPGSVVGSLKAYQQGGLINLNDDAQGWVACPPRASGGGGDIWNLVAKNGTNAEGLTSCTGINLAVHELASGTIAAWQYT